jgi:hypothetical protein
MLTDLSTAAGLPKERAALSFVLAGARAADGPAIQSGTGTTEMAIRVLSDPFPLPAGGKPGRYGRYGCSEKGAALVAGEKQAVYALNSGALLQTPIPAPDKERKDSKTGALIIERR